MIWLYLLIPVVIVSGVALYFEKKSGMSLPDDNIQSEKMGEVFNQSQNAYDSHIPPM